LLLLPAPAQIRFRMHLLVAAAALLSFMVPPLLCVAWQVPGGAPPSLEAAAQLAALTLVPSALVYCWELELRGSFVKAATGKDKAA
jgi:hypothetical protein